MATADGAYVCCFHDNTEGHATLFAVQVHGDILYNGKKFDDFVVERTAGYVEQTDQHYPILTVRETLDFAAWCQGTGDREGKSEYV